MADRPQIAVIVRVEDLSGQSYTQAQVDGRTSLQWLKSAIAYCNWRSDDCRNDELRWHYIRGARLLMDVLYEPIPSNGPVAVLSEQTQSPTPFQRELARQPRAELVRLLMEACPRYTNARLISHFTRLKLAGLLIEARSAALATERRVA